MANNNGDSRGGRKNSSGRKRIPNPILPNSLNSTNYVDTAEKVVLHLNGDKAYLRFVDMGSSMNLRPKSEIDQNQKFALTTTKIRNLLSLLNVLQQMIKEESDKRIKNEVTLGKIQYFKMRCAYEAGREPAVKDFVKKANLMDYIDQIGDSKERFEVFFHYVEALVAYHRYYGGRNN